MRARTYNGIMIYNRAAVHQCRAFNLCIRIHYRSLHDKTAWLQSHTRTYHCGRMHNRRNFISLFQQFIRPEQTRLIIAKCSNRNRIVLVLNHIITAHTDHIVFLYHIIQKHYLFVSQCLCGLLDHMTKAAGSKD